MADRTTLTAYLVPRITGQVENAATEALAYILNESESSMQALNDLIREAGSDVGPIARVKTQVTEDDASRPDMTGYDANGVRRLIVEVKFWAPLLEDQASGYARRLGGSEPAMLLFVVPKSRVATLWAEIENQIGAQFKWTGVLDTRSEIKSAELAGTGHHVMLVNWSHVLDRMYVLAGSDDVKSDIGQLRGLAQAQDAQAFLPIHPEELSPAIGSRMAGYTRLIDDVVDSRGVLEGWMDVRKLRATPRRYGYGRYFRLRGVTGDFWFGINHELWASGAATPLWLSLTDQIGSVSIAVARQLKVEVSDGCVPIYPRLGVEYDEILDGVASQIRRLAVILAHEGGQAMNIGFDKEYKRLEAAFKRQVIEDNRDLKIESTYLPNIVPKGPVDYVLIAMEPSTGVSGRKTAAADSWSQSGRNFTWSFEDFILHYCMRKYLCRDGESYHITDLAKGAIAAGLAGKKRSEKYERWYPHLERELRLLSNQEKTRIIAIGKVVADFLKTKDLCERVESVYHYSWRTASHRNKAMEPWKEEFQEFCRRIDEDDFKKSIEEVLRDADMEQYLPYRPQGGVPIRLTEYRRKLMFYYKKRFEQLRDVQHIVLSL